MTKEELFKDIWNTCSVSCDTSYKQWIKTGFNWMYGWYECEVSSKNYEIKELEKENEKLKTKIDNITPSHTLAQHNQDLVLENEQLKELLLKAGADTHKCKELHDWYCKEWE